MPWRARTVCALLLDPRWALGKSAGYALMDVMKTRGQAVGVQSRRYPAITPRPSFVREPSWCGQTLGRRPVMLGLSGLPKRDTIARGNSRPTKGNVCGQGTIPPSRLRLLPLLGFST